MLPSDGPAADDADGWLARLQAEAPPDLRRFHAEDLHATVAFLGPCGEEAARAAFATATEEVTPIPVRLGRLVPMGPPRRPSALSLELEDGREEVAALITRWRPAMWRAASAREDDRPAKPHITVLRPPRRASPAERQRALDWAARQPPVNVAVTLDRLALYTWAEDRRRRQFQVVASRPFLGGMGQTRQEC